MGLAATLVLAGCGGAVSDEHEIDEPVTLVPVEGTDLTRVILTEHASERLGIQTARVASDGTRTVIPSDALFVQPDGTFWVYVNPEPLVFVRHEIVLENDDGERAVLTAGPPAGTEVVTVGVPELLGAEYEVGH